MPFLMKVKIDNSLLIDKCLYVDFLAFRSKISRINIYPLIENVLATFPLSLLSDESRPIVCAYRIADKKKEPKLS